MATSSASSVFVSSLSENDDNSSISDIQVSQLQAEILQQSKDIEQYILDSRHEEDNASLTVLKSLFVLFKSELSVNLKLRRLLVEERKKVSQASNCFKSFFHSLHKSGYRGIKDFEAVLSCINEQKNKISCLQKASKQLKEEKMINKQLHIQVVDLQNAISIQSQSENDKDSEVQKLNSLIDHQKNDFDTIVKELREKNDLIEELKKKIIQQNTLFEKSTDEITKLKQELNLEKSAKISQSDETKSFFIHQIQVLQNENEILKKKGKEIEINKEKEISALNAQNIIDIQTIKEECADLIRQKTKEIESNELKFKQEQDKYSNQINKLQNTVTENNIIFQNQKKEISGLKTQIAEIENKNSDLCGVNIELKKKIKKIIRKLKIINESAEETGRLHQSKVEQIKIQYENQMKGSISSVETEYNNKIAQAESTIRQLRITSDEQKSEMNTLRELIRKLSFNLQQEEAENARLQTSLQMNKYSAAGKSSVFHKKRAHRKGDSQDYSSPSSDSSFIWA